MGRGLVCDDVRPQAALLRTLDQFGQEFGCIATDGNGHGLFALGVMGNPLQRLVQIGCLFVHVACAQPEVDAGLLALNVERASARKSGGQGLCTPHAAQAGGQNPATRQVAMEVLATRFHKGFVGALDDALAANVNPAASRHLAVHHQACAIQFIEVLPGGPLGHQIGIGNQHPRRARVGAKHAHRFARLHQQGLVRLEFAQRIQNGIEAGPVARRFANAAVHHEFIGVFCHGRIQVVLDHAVGRLDFPIGTVQGAAMRRPHRSRLGIQVL